MRQSLLKVRHSSPQPFLDPHDAPSKAYKRVNELDGYHPVSLVLNCQNYFFTEYTHQSADIILGDPYTIGINATWSVVYNTSCTEDYGDCGCVTGWCGLIQDCNTTPDATTASVLQPPSTWAVGWMIIANGYTGKGGKELLSGT